MKFGIEIECEIDAYQAVQALHRLSQTERSIRVFDDVCAYHHHRDFRVWRVERDSSVRNGCEIVSPILDTERSGFTQIKKVCKALIDAGAKINVSCGLHVHLGVPNLTTKWLKIIMKRYADNRSAIDAFMPRSRRVSGQMGMRYACYMGNVIREHWFTGRNVSINRFVRNCNKYCAINPTNFPRLGTIEFRQHSGTLCHKKIKNWVTFLIAFVEASRAAAEVTVNVPVEVRQNTRRRRPTKKELVLNILNERAPLNEYVSSHILVERAGLASTTSLKRIITLLRNDGHDIRYSFISGYCCLSGITSCSTQSVTSLDNLPELWHNIPNSVKNFYRNRADVLSRT